MPLAAWVIAAANVVLMLAVSDRYGFQQDELYFLVASHHLAFGYVDQPPLAVLLARTTDLFGVNPTAIRILPALAGGAIVVLAARLAALFGGGRAARVIAALAVAIAPVFMAANHIGNTTPYDLLAWTVVTVCAAMALLRDRPRWWLGAGVAAGIGVEDEYLILTLLAALAIGILVTPAHRAVMKTRWPWLGGGIALAIWLPNLAWQAANGWPQLTMASALHQQNTSTADYTSGLPAQLAAAGLLGIPLVIAGFITLWRAAQLRFLGVAATLIVIYVLVWIPGKVYYADGILPAVLAAGSVPAERWIARARRPRARRAAIGVLALAGTVVVVPLALPLLPIATLHTVSGTTNIADGIGWPQLTAEVAAQDAALTRAGQPPTSIFTGADAEAGALDVYGGPYHLPPVISGHNTFWLWGPGDASDTTVLYVDGPGQLWLYFASCRQLAVYNPPDQVKNNWNDLAIGVCTGPSGSWKTLWPHLKHYN
ncbi:MAG TPA: glycosyltransferase family 39 protein [Streptosporangiaceae bacterium]